MLRYLAILITGIFLFWSCSTRHNKDKTINPNIIVIISDDQGWGDLSINGNTNLHTPNIDLLAERGVRFNHFYVSPVCSPTRAEFFTGRYHSRSGVSGTSEGLERMDLDETTIAEVFKEEGYATAAFGKWHNGMQYPYHPNARGFDEFYGFCAGHWGNYFSPLLEHNGKLVKGEGFVTDDFTDKAITFIENNRNNPFFLYVPYNTPHVPMQVPDRWWNKFKDKELELRGGDPDKEDTNFTRATLAMCENIDWNVGRLMNKLKELNLEENTIVLYLSDNGPHSSRWNGGMKGLKGSTDEGGVRSPLIIRWPGVIEPNSQIEEIAGAIDLLPTLIDLAGIEYEIQKPLDGLSLKPLLNDNKTWKDRFIFSHWGGRTSVRSQKYRLDHQGKLYDMTADPGQLTDVSAAEPDIARNLTTSVEQWKANVLPGILTDERRFPVGHPNFKYTQLPARDGKAHGDIVRSDRFPNDSFFTNWTKLDDKITWNVDVLSEGDYEVEIYYTCPVKDIGATVQLSLGSHKLTAEITEAHDPPFIGKENDRVKRIVSYVKDFKPLKMGAIRLEKGVGELTLKCLDIPGSQVMDFRLLMLTRKE